MDKIMRSNEKEKNIELTQNLYDHKAFDNVNVNKFLDKNVNFKVGHL